MNKGIITANIDKWVVETTTWADFVFENDYTLMPLQELNNYIIDNKHLPEIPTTKEVKENGISVGEMNAKLLQKIEELTLYTIDQQKQIDISSSIRRLLGQLGPFGFCAVRGVEHIQSIVYGIYLQANVT